MKTARILLAAITLATLAACGTESVTGPAVPGAARHGAAPTTSGATTAAGEDTSLQSNCNGTVVFSVDALGNTVTTCVVNPRGPLVGSGS